MNNSEIFRTAWAYARDAADRFGGKASEFFRESLRQVRAYGEEAKQLESTYEKVRRVENPKIEAIRAVAQSREYYESSGAEKSSGEFDKTMGELYFKNFVDMIGELPLPLYEMILKAIDRADIEKWKIGIALNSMPSNIMMYVGYMDLPSDEAIQLFISDLLNYIPMDEESRLELMDEFEDYSMG